MKVPEKYRITRGLMASTPAYGNNGAFEFPHYRINEYKIFCIVSDGMGWEHVSVTVVGDHQKTATRCPTWEEMCWVKTQFFDDEESVMQLHPPKSQWVNNHPYCLHLWKNKSHEIILPPSMFVGLPALNSNENTTQ